MTTVICAADVTRKSNHIFPHPPEISLITRMFHELVSRDRGDNCPTGQPQGVGSEAYLNSTSQGPTPEDARKDAYIRGRSRQRVKYSGYNKRKPPSADQAASGGSYRQKGFNLALFYKLTIHTSMCKAWSNLRDPGVIRSAWDCTDIHPKLPLCHN